MNEEIHWEAYARQPRERGPDWYWAVSIIALSIAITSIILDNILFAVFIILSACVLFLGNKMKPPLVSFRLTERGIREGKIVYPWNTLLSFSVEEEYGEPRIIVKSQKMLSPYLIIPLGETDPDTVRQFLQNYLLEEELHEPLSKKIMEFLGF